MNERLLQYIWQFQYFNQNDLFTQEGERVRIISPGILNTNQGPDFSDARIRINEATWAGAVELHNFTSEWKKHDHSSDKNYNNVILHVVWQHDKRVNDLPVLELHDRVPKFLLDRYEKMMKLKAFIPCVDNIRNIPKLVMLNWKDRLIAGRLERRSRIIGAFLEENNLHWEETFWWTLARNFGTKVNGQAFESVARSITLNILAKHKHQLHQVEAILLGQAGLLEEKFTSSYPVMLKKEFEFLKKKYKLPNVFERVQLLRMRPGNFPVIRFAQLAMLITQSAHLFSKIKEEPQLQKVREIFDVTANDYWCYHYFPGDESRFLPKRIGETMIDNIIINTIVPMLYAYGQYHNIPELMERAVSWLHQSGREKNKITNGFIRAGVENRSAGDSQALLELKNEYCDKRRCLDCAIGNQLLKG